MGKSVKKATRAVTKPIATVSQVASSVSKKTLDVTGVNNVVKKSVGIDLNNITDVVNDTAHLRGSTGSDKFKAAALDAAKIGIAMSTGGAGSGAALSYTQGAGAILLTDKIKNKGSVSLGDIGNAAGFETNVGGIDLGNVKVTRAKTPAVKTPGTSSNFLGDMISDISPGKSTNIFLILGIGGVVIAAIFFIIRNRK